jgi:proline iminopeptidase
LPRSSVRFLALVARGDTHHRQVMSTNQSLRSGALLIVLMMTGCATSSMYERDAKLSVGIHQAIVDGTTIQYEVRGHGPLLVVQAPAWGIGSTYLRNGLAPLTSHFRVVTFDPPGSGASSRPPDHVPLNDRELIEVLESLRQYWSLDSFDLLGHSNGSALALGYAERYPARVRKLVLIGSQVFGVPGGEAAQKFADERENDPRYKFAIQRFRDGSPDTDEAYTRHFFDVAAYYLYDPDKDRSAFLKTVTTSLSAWPEHAALPERKTPPMREQDEFQNVRARTLIIEGREDPVCPVPVSEALHAGISGSKLVIYEQTGHFPWIEQPARFFADVRRFLER